MAKISKSVAYKNATISHSDMTITEIAKDEERIYSLSKLLDEWDGIRGISLTIKLDNELSENEE